MYVRWLILIQTESLASAGAQQRWEIGWRGTRQRKNCLRQKTPYAKFLTCLNYSMEQSPLWQADSSAAGQDIHHILSSPKVHCRIHNQWRSEGGFGGSTPPPPKFRRPSKIVPNSTRLWKLLKIAEFRTPTPQDVRQKGSEILKLPPVRNCFTLAITNKLVVIINSLTVRKIKKILLYEMKFLVPNYSCLQNPWLGGYRPQFSVLSVLCPQLNLFNPPNKITGYATVHNSPPPEPYQSIPWLPQPTF